jgi:hypothetical protein
MQYGATGTARPQQGPLLGIGLTDREDYMRRREFIAGLGGVVVAWPVVAQAQQAMPLEGSIYSVSAASWTDNMDGFRRGLAEVGFADGRNIAIDYRWADGSIERMLAKKKATGGDPGG